MAAPTNDLPVPNRSRTIQRSDSQHDLLRQRMGGIYVDRSRVEEALGPSLSGNRRIVDLATGDGRW